MENRKLLLVAVSVGLFLVIVIAATILVFSPKDLAIGPGASKAPQAAPATPASGTSASGTPVSGTPVSGTPASTQNIPPSGTAAQAAGSETAAGKAGDNAIYINGGNGARAERKDGGSTQTVITIPSPADSPLNAPPRERPPAAAKPAPSVQIAQPAAKPAQPATKPAQPAAKPAQPAAKPAQPAAKPAQPAASPVQKPAAPKEPAETPAKSAWWVQTNSYTNRSLADNSKEVLKSKGIASVVTNAVVNGKTYYRVRVGPYTSRTEAEYWLSLIKTIKDMENSQIWQSQ